MSETEWLAEGGDFTEEEWAAFVAKVNAVSSGSADAV